MLSGGCEARQDGVGYLGGVGIGVEGNQDNAVNSTRGSSS